MSYFKEAHFRALLFCFLLFSVICISYSSIAGENHSKNDYSYRAVDIAELGKGFENPPIEAGPWVYWFCFDNVITAEEMKREIREMVSAGIAGAELRFVEFAWWRNKDVVDKELAMDGLSMHYYCDSGRKRREATQFNLEDWFYQFKKALWMEELLDKHIAVMDKCDPDNKIGLIVDEWGCWHHPMPGTNPKFLYQQNTLHDALVAGVNLNIFNQRCRRVKMANIAQMVNVLQSVILTRGEKMILTPTYYTFKMYAVHQDATLLPTELTCDDYTWADMKLPSVSVSASKDSSAKIHITLCNIDPENPVTLDCKLEDAAAKKVTGQILTHDDINAHNAFDRPDAMRPAVFNGAKIKDGTLTVTMPAKSVVVLEVL